MGHVEQVATEPARLLGLLAGVACFSTEKEGFDT